MADDIDIDMRMYDESAGKESRRDILIYIVEILI